MAIGIVFEYLLIAALLAPVAWVMWWAASTLGEPLPLRCLARARPADAQHPSELLVSAAGRHEPARAQPGHHRLPYFGRGQDRRLQRSRQRGQVPSRAGKRHGS